MNYTFIGTFTEVNGEWVLGIDYTLDNGLEGFVSYQDFQRTNIQDIFEDIKDFELGT